MQTRLALAAAATLLALSTPALAQNTVIVQETAPVTTESTVVIPGEVRTYVMEQRVPSVAYEGDVVVGKVVPDAVEIHAVDGHADYGYTVVNERRVIVNPQTRTIIQVLE